MQVNFCHTYSGPSSFSSRLVTKISGKEHVTTQTLGLGQLGSPLDWLGGPLCRLGGPLGWLGIPWVSLVVPCVSLVAPGWAWHSPGSTCWYLGQFGGPLGRPNKLLSSWRAQLIAISEKVPATGIKLWTIGSSEELDHGCFMLSFITKYRTGLKFGWLALKCADIRHCLSKAPWCDPIEKYNTHSNSWYVTSHLSRGDLRYDRRATRSQIKHTAFLSSFTPRGLLCETSHRPGSVAPAARLVEQFRRFKWKIWLCFMFCAFEPRISLLVEG
jgi:hypothetical protein